MLDFDLSKMALIGVVALVVLGPERLPRVARTAGALLGRAQRYINDVKSEVAREIELDGLREMKSNVEAAARNVENSIQDTVREHTSVVNDAWKSAVGVVTSETGLGADGTHDAGAAAAGDTSYGGVSYGGTGGSGASDSRYGAGGALAPKRRNWRVRQAATPVWYKRATTRRTHVQSGAARVARHQPASLRRPARFL